MWYGQNELDRKIAALLPGYESRLGFYIDVGAWLPETDSATKHFYDRGWRGINVEPVPDFYRVLKKARPRDINLCAAIVAFETKKLLTFYSVLGTGLSTFSPVLADRMAKNSLVKEIKVLSYTLAELYRFYVPTEMEIEFLKIDVEGWETEVIRGGDWKKYRPRLVIVEAKEPGTGRPTHMEFENFLIFHAYHRVTPPGDDEGDRFYLRNDYQVTTE